MANLDTKDLLIFDEVNSHANLGFDETEKRATGKNRIGSISFNEADELFRSWIKESDWPYDALLFDPRVFTFIFEKTSRLIAGKLRGRLIPREGSDVLAAKINNELLSFQWDQENHGGTMLSKWALMDLNTRKYGAAFGLNKWRYETQPDGKVVFDAPTMKVLNNRDCAQDLTANTVEDCNWFQVREYVILNELKRVNDHARTQPIYRNLDRLSESINSEAVTSGGDSRSSNWQSRNREIAGIESDPIGKDKVFKTIEIVTEYRKDRWITFAPKHGLILRDIPNPYKNNEIPIVMLRYYPVDDDLYGLSEIEPVKSIQKAINALLSHYVDEINQKLYAPIAIGPGVRQHTLEWGKGARWIMNNPMTDFRVVETSSAAASYFNSTYSTLVASMMSALGETSLGVSNIQPAQNDKTATEVKALVQQRNSRDNFNQIFLAEAIERQMMLWYTMNQLLLFSDPKKKHYIVRVVGRDALSFFQNAGMDQQIVDETKTKDLGKMQELMSGMGGQPVLKANDFMKPKYPINVGTEKNPKIVSKLQMDELGKGASLYMEPSDLKGNFDFIADVESMSLQNIDREKTGRQTAITLLLSNPNVLAMLAQEKVRPKFKELFISWLEDQGFQDAEKFFGSVEDVQQLQSPSNAANIVSTGEQPTAQQSAVQQKPPTMRIDFEDLPAEGRVQMAAQAGIKLNPNSVTPPLLQQPSAAPAMGGSMGSPLSSLGNSPQGLPPMEG